MRVVLFEPFLVFVLLSIYASAFAVSDPTRPYEFIDEPEFIEIDVEEDSVDWRLKGIRIVGDKRTAILNGMIIREGETIENAKVLTINSTSVVLQSGSQHLVIKMLDASVKKPVKNKNFELEEKRNTSPSTSQTHEALDK